MLRVLAKSTEHPRNLTTPDHGQDEDTPVLLILTVEGHHWSRAWSEGAEIEASWRLMRLRLGAWFLAQNGLAELRDLRLSLVLQRRGAASNPKGLASSIYMYIDIYVEIDIGTDIDTDVYISMYTCYIYIYIYVGIDIT